MDSVDGRGEPEMVAAAVAVGEMALEVDPQIVISSCGARVIRHGEVMEQE